jgi:transcriptional regulator with XRE-family HTH domain
MLGEQIKKYRKKEGMSQEELANQLNVSRQTISKYESNISLPDINKIIELSKIFHISLNEFLMIEDEEEMDVKQIQAMIEQLVYSQNQQDKKRKNIYIIVAILFIVLFLTIIGLYSYFNGQFLNINNSISKIKQNVVYKYDTTETTEYSYLNSLDTKVISINGDGTYTLNVSTNLKEYDDSTEVTFIIKQGDDKQEVKLERNNDIYSGDITVNIDDIDEAQVTIKNNDNYQNEIVYNPSSGIDFMEDYSSYLKVSYDIEKNDDNFDFKNNSGIIQLSVNLNDDIDGIEIDGQKYKAKLSKVKVTAKINDKTIGEFEKKESKGSETCNVNVSIDSIAVDNILELDITIYDTFGNEYSESLNYRYSKEYMPAGNGEKYFESV